MLCPLRWRRRRLRVRLTTVVGISGLMAYLYFQDKREARARMEEEEDLFRTTMRERRSRIRRVCNVTEGGYSVPELFSNFVDSDRLRKRIFFIRELDLLYCPVYKVSTTSWLNNFILIHGNTSLEEKVFFRKWLHDHTNEVAQRLHPWMTAEEAKRVELNATAKVMISRHPFHRLVSAYRDKFERVLEGGRDGDYFYTAYGQVMRQIYRKNATARFGESFFSRENNYGAPLPVSRDRGWRTPALPTFWEFARFLIDRMILPQQKKGKKYTSNLNNEHWRPMSDFCAPCRIGYDFVLRFESLRAEERVFKRVLGVDLLLEEREAALKAASEDGAKYKNSNHPENMTEDQLTQLYFSQLSEEDVTNLFRFYEADFRLFGYEFKFRSLKLPPEESSA